MSTLARTPTGDVQIPLSIERDLATLALRKIQDQFGLWLGEWFLDTSIGFPWIPRVLSLKNPSFTEIRALFRQAILLTPGVVSLEALSMSLDPRTRQLEYSFAAKLDSGFTVTGGSGQPFVVDGSP